MRGRKLLRGTEDGGGGAATAKISLDGREYLGGKEHRVRD
jgi:hypothetical protein